MYVVEVKGSLFSIQTSKCSRPFLEKILSSPLSYLSTFGSNQLTTYVWIYFRPLFCWVGLLVYPYFSLTALTDGKPPDTVLSTEREIVLVGVVCTPFLHGVTFPGLDLHCYTHWGGKKPGQFIQACERMPLSLTSSRYSEFTNQLHILCLSHSYTDSVPLMHSFICPFLTNTL